MKVTIFKSVKDTSVPFYRDVDFILSRIKEGKSKELIEKIRKEKDKELRNKIKQQLPAICFSGEFSDRKDKSILKHSGIICLDFDGFKTKKELLNKKQEIKNDVHTHSVFISPSGNGLKVLVKVPSDIDNHVKYFMSLQDYYNCSEFDTTCKNISRVCYESYDKDIFINKNSSVYESKEVLNHEQHEYKNHSPTLVLTKQDAIVDRLKKWWENKYGMIDGQRNNNIYILASSLNDFGIDKGLASYVMSEYVSDGFTFNEMSATINSAYQNASNYNTRFFEDSEAIDQIKNKLKIGVPKKEIRNILKTKGYDPDTIDTVIKEEERSDKGSEFWIKSEKGVVSIIPFKFKEFLEKHGFYKYTPEGSTNYIFIVIKSNIIDNTTDDLIKDYVLN